VTTSLGFFLPLFGAATLAGFLGALLGVGGGVFIVPTMVLMFHLPLKIAVAASIVSVIATSNAGGSSYVDQHIANLKLAMLLEIPTTLGALIGSVVAVYLSEWLMLIVFAALLAYMSWVSFRTRNLDDERIASGNFARVTQDRLCKWLGLRGQYADHAHHKSVEYHVTGAPQGIAVALSAGAASGLLGVGGGVLKVSAMNRYMNVPMKVAVGTSKLMIGVTAAISSLIFFLAGLIHFYVVAPVALGTTAGASLGTLVMNRVKTRSLKWLFAVLMAYLAYGMITKALALRFGLHLPVLT
jgi:uncharacterized membrane protein YfcA